MEVNNENIMDYCRYFFYIFILWLWIRSKCFDEISDSNPEAIPDCIEDASDISDEDDSKSNKKERKEKKKRARKKLKKLKKLKRLKNKKSEEDIP